MTSLSKGNKELRNGNYNEAIKHYKKALIETPHIEKAIKINILIAQNKIKQNKTTLAESENLEPQFDGRIESIKNGRISGWAVDLNCRHKSIEVELLLNGVVYQSRKVSISRPDVEKKYPGNLVCGFEFNIPLDKLSSPNFFISARIKDTEHIILGRNNNYILPDKPRCAPVHTKKQQFELGHAGVTIIIPIYNAPNELQECISSVLKYTNLSDNYKLILSDDASPDPEVSKVLNRYINHEKITILRNKRNLGYTGNINRAILTTENSDIVLLNSDTRVTPNWLNLLQRAALQSPIIGTVSALSDNAGAFSVPRRNCSNPLPLWLNEAEYGRLITHTSMLRHLRIPTTSGFCMYIKRAVFDTIGLFDIEKFPKGYGEENDFCMRASYAGWSHVLADNVIVYHERSASFLESKTKLMERASDLIPKMYPEYNTAVAQAFVQNSEINQLRFEISYQGLRYPKLPRPRVAYVIGVESGGTPQTNMDLMSSVQDEYEPYLILCTTSTLRIFKIVGSRRIELEKISLEHPVMPISHDSDSYQNEISDILQRYAFELIHIRHIGRHGLSLIRTAKSLRIKILFSLHDFYTICPNVKLLDAKNNYCSGKCTTGDNDCNIELWDSRYTPKLKHHWIHSWRKIFQSILLMCDGLITTSLYARTLIKSTYNLNSLRFDVIPHARDFSSFNDLSAPLQKGEPLRVFVPGHLVPAKGLYLIKAIKDLDKKNQIEFHFAGTTKEDLSSYGISHGPYNRDDFSLLVEKIKPHVGGVFSIWPETYSHTLTELWSCGLPVITSHYGATGERLNEHGGGWVIQNMNPQEILNILIHLINKPSEIENRKKEVLAWQHGYGRDYSVAVMSERYKRLYSQTLCLEPTLQKEVIILPFGATSEDTPITSKHLTPALDELFGHCHIMSWPTTTLNILTHLEEPDVLVIQYHSEEKNKNAYKSLTQAKTNFPNLKIVLDVAADSLSLISDNTDFFNQRPHLKWLITNSDHIIGPSEFIEGKADRIQPLNIKQMVVNESGYSHLPNLNTSSNILLPSSTISYDEHICDLMEKEVAPGSAELIAKHNAPLVAANFALINWDSMLTKPRIDGLVSIIIPNFDKVGITEKLLLTLTKVTKGDTQYEIIIIDNGSCHEVRTQIEKLTRIDARIRIICSPLPLRFSVACNYGAAYAQGEYILFLNNDMEVFEETWLDALMLPLKNSEDVGIAGGKLVYPDHTIQHAGLVFSAASHMAYHIYIGEHKDAPHVNKQREMQAVTGACLAIRSTDFAKLRGFNPLFINGCEDVDLCLRMRHNLHRKIVYTPESVLIHLEGKSPGRGKNVLLNRKIFSHLWGKKIKPDDRQIYADDGFSNINYEFDNNWLAQEFRAVSAKPIA